MRKGQEYIFISSALSRHLGSTNIKEGGEGRGEREDGNEGSRRGEGGGGMEGLKKYWPLFKILY